MSEVNIEFAETKDIADIAEIARQTGKMHEEKLPEYFKPSSITKQTKFISDVINGEDTKVFKAIIDGEITGYLVLYVWDMKEEYFVNPKVGYVGSLGVKEQYRHHGIGKALMKSAENWCKEHDIGAIELDVFAFNSNAARFYDSLGYNTLKLRRSKILK